LLRIGGRYGEEEREREKKKNKDRERKKGSILVQEKASKRKIERGKKSEQARK